METGANAWRKGNALVSVEMSLVDLRMFVMDGGSGCLRKNKPKHKIMNMEPSHGSQDGHFEGNDMIPLFHTQAREVLEINSLITGPVDAVGKAHWHISTLDCVPRQSQQ